MADDQPHRIDLKDLVSLVVSASALFLSGWTYYATDIEVKNSAKARIVSVRVSTGPGEKADHALDYTGTTIILRIAYINSGNRPAVVIGTNYFLASASDPNGIRADGDTRAVANAFPFVLSPHDVRVIDVAVPMQNIVDNYGNGAIPSKAEQPNSPIVIGGCKGRTEIVPADAPKDKSLPRSLAMGLDYVALDWQGQLHNTASGMQLKLDVTPTGWKSLSSATSDACNEYSLTSLLN